MSDPLSPLQFDYRYYGDMDARSARSHELTAMHGEQPVGMMHWDSDHIIDVHVEPEFQRQGVATALWNEGHRLAAENRTVSTPKHSNDRTNAGDAWARNVGGRLPRRKTGRV